MQVGGSNYLVPVDAELANTAALDFEMVRLDLVQRTMERETATNVLFLDACRDNPLARNLARAMGTRSTDIGRGLAAAESGVGTLISFSTQPGNVALDGSGRNSPYAAALVKGLAAPGEDLSAMLIGVRNEVMAATHNRQVPWEHSALRAPLSHAAWGGGRLNATIGCAGVYLAGTHQCQDARCAWRSSRTAKDGDRRTDCERGARPPDADRRR